MLNYFEKICRIIYRERKKAKSLLLKYHPDEESLASFLDQQLSEKENDQLLKHLLICDRCAEYVSVQLKIQTHLSREIPVALLEKIKKMVNQSFDNNLLEIFIKLKAKALEIMQTTGDVLVGQELIPAPVLRSRKIDEFKEEVSILKDLHQIRVLAKIQNKNTQSFNLTINVKEKIGQKTCKDLRVTLVKDGIELESYLSDSLGNTFFENILPGDYRVEVSRQDQKEAVIDLKVKA
ncbi:MAG: zf-HC2 domain-containing protein [Candidatus Omnitrophota bacterium]